MNLNRITLLVGGSRSGKSRHALELAEQLPGEHRVFIATCIPQDDEMKERVSRHKEERSSDWNTVEAPVKLPETIIEESRNADIILVDCLTLWISNLFLETDDASILTDHLRKLTASLEKSQCPVLLVSNEVGTGIVPENRLARQFRDMAGFANQKVAKCSDEVIWMVAGIPVTIKS